MYVCIAGNECHWLKQSYLLWVQVLSVSPESEGQRSEVTGGVVESRSGRVADLVQQFDEPDGGKVREGEAGREGGGNKRRKVGWI